MKKFCLPRLNSWLATASTATVLFAAGCATPTEHSFNQDYGQYLVTEPQYYIEDETDNRFKIVVHQGKPSTGAERVLDVKTAATDIARAEAQRLGWERWQLNYVQEKNEGWMHIIVAYVKREPYAEPMEPAAPPPPPPVSN